MEEEKTKKKDTKNDRLSSFIDFYLDREYCGQDGSKIK
ncbi:hypothetical protein lbkm_2705 [Lachnospiraceae bacterium KM106-2]|nr:hypothetical protein lbkm_2705 [Lachnospiraceae bacterium KM106-2]